MKDIHCTRTKHGRGKTKNRSWKASWSWIMSDSWLKNWKISLKNSLSREIFNWVCLECYKSPQMEDHTKNDAKNKKSTIFLQFSIFTKVGLDPDSVLKCQVDVANFRAHLNPWVFTSCNTHISVERCYICFDQMSFPIKVIKPMELPVHDLKHGSPSYPYLIFTVLLFPIFLS